jgi:hypothetical protein
VDDLRLDAVRELRVDDLVGVGAEVRWRRDAAQEVDAALPAAVEELRLVDERHAGAHRVARSRGAGVEPHHACRRAAR